MSKPFYFRYFVLHQEGSAMKAGTDSMVLGAWTPAGPDVKRILDIGTGSGVLSLMLAQRCRAHIDAVESDPSAARQAEENVRNSRWAGQIRVFEKSLQEFAASGAERDAYDLIVSNPPFFEGQPAPGGDRIRTEQRAAARFYDSLPFHELLRDAGTLLSDKGMFFVILPEKAAAEFVILAEEEGLYLLRALLIRSYADRPPVRRILGFGRNAGAVQEDELILYNAPGKYSDEYIALTQDYHARSLR